MIYLDHSNCENLSCILNKAIKALKIQFSSFASAIMQFVFADEAGVEIYSNEAVEKFY